MRRWTALACLCAVGLLNDGAAGQASGPAIDPLLASQLEQVDQHAAAVKTLSARFEQKKFTALLKKPLVSTGTVRASGEVVRWDTLSPEPTVLWTDGNELRLYYPQEHLEEIYPIDQRLADLLTSPLPRLRTIEAHFAIARADAKVGSEVALPAGLPTNEPNRLSLDMTPTEASLKQHVQDVVALLDMNTGVVEALRTTDSDGDQTLIAFSDAKLNVPLSPSDLDLKVPPDTKISHPLEGMGGGGMPASTPSP